MKKFNFFSLIIILAVFACIGAAGYRAYCYFLKPNSSIVSAFEEGKLNLVIEGEVVESGPQARIVDGEVLLPMEIVREYFDPNIYWDDELKKVTITTKDKVIRMKTDDLNALVNNKPVTLKIPVTVEKNVIYIPIDFLREFYNIEITCLEKPQVIIIDYKNSIRQIAEPISPDAVVRKGRSTRYPIIKKFDMADGTGANMLRVFEEYDRWYKVRTADGAVGYVEKKHVVIKRLEISRISQNEQAASPAWKPEKGRISLVWEMIYSGRPDFSKIGRMEGLDVISPTWFQVAREDGTLINRADSVYVDWAHRNGYRVWALVSNDFSNPQMTKKILANTDARDNIIRQLLVYASLYKLDGINIDFENIYKEDKDNLTQFVREAAPLLREQGLVVSIDVTVPDGSDNWSLCYDRKALGQAVDYVMLMAYDQHWSTSPNAGSVAQLSWVEKNLKKTLEMVPREKLLLGIPFYTRLWKEEADKDGRVKVTNTVLSMEEAKKLLNENNAHMVWDNESAQYYSEFKKDNATYKIWLEDESSINLKSSLVQKYKLAGAAAWRRSDETQAIWSILNRNLKVYENYQEWASANQDARSGGS